MALVILVAIDIADGEVVRVVRGRLEEKTTYRDDPVKTAIQWQQEGAEWLHVVDLDLALGRMAKNSSLIAGILESVEIPVQVSGGIRSIEAVSRWISLGASRVAVGTKALDEAFVSTALEEFGDKVVAAVDYRGGRVRVSGWQEEVDEGPVELARRLASAGVARLIVTDIERDGTLEGPNLEGIEQVLDAVEIPVIASGGVSGAQDIRRLTAFENRGLEGIIVGKALYSGAVTLDSAQQAAHG